MTKEYGMFTPEGNYMVGRIAEAAERLAQWDGSTSAWHFANRELRKLATADEFGEATDTAVRDTVHEIVCRAGNSYTEFYV
jgi:hypothetical protein